MKITIKYAALYFSISISLMIAVFAFFPSVFPGDSFTIIWYHIINLPIGLFLLPIFSYFISRLPVKNKISHVLLYFLSIIIIINIIPLFGGHFILTLKLFKGMFTPNRMQVASIVEFLNPIISFYLTYLLFRKSEMVQ